MKRLLVLLSLTAMILTTLGAGLTAAKPPADSTDYATILSKVEKLERNGASRSAIDRMLEREFGWVRETEEPSMETLAAPSASDITLYKPTIYRNVPANRYEVTARWQWKNCGTPRCWMVNYPGVNGNVGGPNAFAINTSRNVNELATTFATYDEDGSGRIYSNPDVFDADGVGFTEQDTQHATPWDNFSWDHGTLVFAFRLTGACVPGQLFKFKSKLAHTWDSTSVSSMSISLTGIDFGFSSSEARWVGLSPTPLDWKPC